MGKRERLEGVSATIRRMGARRAVFLDRDGTLNASVVREGKPYPPASIAEFELIPGVGSACQALADAGYLLIVATNQPDVGRGTQLRSVVEGMHQKLYRLIPALARIEVCYDPGKGEASLRRKPEPGMLLDAAADLQIDLSRSWMVGDRWRDIDCGKRAGVRTILIDFDYAEQLSMRPDFTVRTFVEAAAIVLAES